jgi:ribonuclease P protein component
VLDRRHRLTTSAGFTTATRRGRRAGTRHLVLHLGPAAASPAGAVQAVPAQVGFVVSKAVGNAVHRNRVKRRLRHLARERVDRLPDGAVLVVRALPAAAGATYTRLGQDFDAALRRLGLSTDTSPEPSPDLARQEVKGR